MVLLAGHITMIPVSFIKPGIRLSAGILSIDMPWADPSLLLSHYCMMCSIYDVRIDEAPTKQTTYK